MPYALKSRATNPQSYEIRKSQTLMLCASYFGIPHTLGWGGNGWKNPLGRLKFPQSPTPPPKCSAWSSVGPNIPIIYTRASQHCIPLLVPLAKLAFPPQIAKSPVPRPQPPLFPRAENTRSREPVTHRGHMRLSQELTRSSGERVTVLGCKLRGWTPGDPGPLLLPAARMVALDF